jgi:hypothetical protein
MANHKTAIDTTPKTRRSKVELTLKQSMFAQAYVGQALGNATQAAALAGYKGTPGYLSVIGHKLVINGKVRAEIARLQEEIGKDKGIGWWRGQVLGRIAHCTQHRDDADPKSAAVDETNGKGYIELYGRHIGAFEEDNRQKSDEIAILLR